MCTKNKWRDLHVIQIWDSDREKDGREFTDLNEIQAEALLEQFNNVSSIKQWLTVDQRPDRQEQWLNLLWKKYA